MKNIAMFVCLLALCTLTLLAQNGSAPQDLRSAEGTAVGVTPQGVSAHLQTIYSNLGSSENRYNYTAGWPVAGPNSDYHAPYSVALRFTPKFNSHVSQVKAAVLYFGSGADQVNISIYGDSGGVPGTLLAGPVTVTNLPTGCCALAVADIPATAVTGGTQYWVVADTPLTGQGSDFSGLWDWAALPVISLATKYSGGWLATNGDARPAGAVLGTIP